jgi:sugar (pentulose or hexulose) kinase
MFVGLDMGTSVAKAAAFAEDGTVTRVEATPVATPGRDGHVDIEEIAAAAEHVISTVCGGADPDLVALTGQGDGLWLVDADGRAVRPALSWLDGRAADLVSGWMADGTAERLYRHTGNVLFPGSSGPLMAWLDRHEPAALDTATTAAHCKDVLHLRLTGERGTDVSDASVPFLDPRTRTWSPTVLQALGLDHRADLLPPIAAGTPYGEANGRLAGLRPGTPVTSGPYDLPACALGAGVTTPGDGLLIVGTTLACEVVVDHLDFTGEPVGFHLATPRPDRHLRALPAMTGTAALDWVLGITGAAHDQVSGMLDESPPGARGVAALPYFSPSGERAPFVDPAARAQFTGLDLRATRADLVRAVCEAIAFAARHCLDTAGLTGSLTVCGGGTRSLPWLRLFADVLGRSLHVARGPEPGARGAVLAGLAAHEPRGATVDFTAWTAPDQTIDPDPARVDFYRNAYADYLTRVQQARQTWHPTTP